MIRISELRKVIILRLASSAFLAQSDDFSVKSQIHSGVPDVRQIKVNGKVIQPFAIGLFLARVLRGSHITMEQTRVDDRIWMPARVEVRAAAKIFFVKTLVIDRVLIYSEYRLTETDVSTASDPVNTIS